MVARILFALISISLLFTAYPVFAEIKIFEKDLEEIVSNDQSREQVEAFTLQKAKRLAIEEAGTFIQSLTFVQNYQLTKDEVMALSSGVVQAKIIGVPGVQLINGVIHVKVKAMIQVDTGILDRQIAEIMKEKGTLKKLEEEQAKVKKLEEKLSSIKSSELKRVEELNAQAIALEQEREKQRLFREEQGLKAQGEMKKAEIERLQKERELQERTASLIHEQEKQRKQEADALANEQDRIRHAQMENEQHWAELLRKSKIAQRNWLVIDDSLSLKQALEEVALLKQELNNLNKRMKYQLEENVKILKKAYALQKELTRPKLPPPLTTKDAFETTAEFTNRRTTYDSAVNASKTENAMAIEKLINDETLKVFQAKKEYDEQRFKVTVPLIERLMVLQARQFVMPGEQVTIELGSPDADKNCFHSTIKYKEKTWSVDWTYTDRAKARDIYNTRAYLKAEALVQLDEASKKGFKMTAARITHLGTREQTVFSVAEVLSFTETKEFIGLLPEVIFVKGGCYQMGDTFGDGWPGEKPVHEVCVDDYYIGKYVVTQGQWKTVMGKNPSEFSNCGDSCPVENVSWENAQEFIRTLNQRIMSGTYRLLTEAEWEYAARNRGKSERWAGTSSEAELGDYAWYSDNSGNMTHPVGQKKPNELGIYDMTGNVMEYVQDIYSDSAYSQYRRNNPIYIGSGTDRVVRGGSWFEDPADVRAAYRRYLAPDLGSYRNGFRLARTP